MTWDNVGYYSEHGDKLMLPGFHIAEEQTVNTATAQGAELAIRVQVMGDDLAVDGQLDRIQLEELANVQRQKHRHLGIAGIQQFFLDSSCCWEDCNICSSLWWWFLHGRS